jgi:hypothetical protein
MGCACGGKCSGGRDPLGMGYLRGFGAYGLGQDDGTGAGDGSDDPIDIEDPTSITGGAVIPPGTVYGPSTPSGLAPGSTLPADSSAVSAFCSSQGETYNPSTDLCNVTTSSGSGTINASQLDAALTSLLTGGTKIAQIATGTTGTLQVTSNELLIGAAILAAIFIIPAALSKR